MEHGDGSSFHPEMEPSPCSISGWNEEPSPCSIPAVSDFLLFVNLPTIIYVFNIHYFHIRVF